MRVLLTGATGYLGGAVLRALVHADHDVVALVRSQDDVAVVRDRGAVATVVDVDRDGDFGREAEKADGVIHCASPGDATSAALDGAVLDAVLPALADSGRPYLHTGGTWVHGSGTITEDTPLAPPPIVAWRPALNARVRAAAEDGVRSVVVAPANAYGHGGGIPALIAGGPIVSEPAPTLVFPGDEQHFGNVFVDDAAAFYALALVEAPAGSYYLVANREAPTVREMAEAISRSHGLEGRVAAEPEHETRSRLSALADALLLDQRIAPDRAEGLGWQPGGPPLLEELEHGSYAPATPAHSGPRSTR